MRTYSLASVLLGLLACLVVAVSCTDRFSPRAVGDIRLRPDSAHLEPGETSVHQVVVFDEDFREMPAEWLPRIDWTLYRPELATLEIDADELRITAHARGKGYLTAELGMVKRGFNVFVRPPGLARIEIEPDPVILSTSGSLWVTTHLYHVDGHEMDPADFRLSWAVADTTLATVPFQNAASDGIVRVVGNHVQGYEAGKPGKTSFRARVSGETALFDLLVTLEPTPSVDAPSVEVEPPSALTVAWLKTFEARDGYEVERAIDVSGPWAHLTYTGSAAWAPYFDTTYTDTGLPPNTTYYYRVRGCNKHGCAVAPSPVGSGTTASGG